MSRYRTLSIAILLSLAVAAQRVEGLKQPDDPATDTTYGCYWIQNYNMGHSRGGEAAVTAARLLEEQPGLGAESFDVKAVISIAPTDGGGQDGNDSRETLTGAATESFLALYGSRDKDVTGSTALMGMNLEPQKTAFAIYDRAGSEGSQEGLGVAGTHLHKAFVFLYGLGHKDFLDADAFGSAAGQAAAKAYSTAFLRWRVFAETNYRGFFDGTWRPESLAATELFHQISSGTRRVVDNFEDGDEDTNYMGDTVSTGTAGFDTFEDGQLHELLRSSPHAGGGLRIAWTEPTYIRWGIPDDEIPLVGNKRNVSSYTHISLRVSQVYADALNAEGEDQDFQLRFFTGDGFSVKVPVSLHGRVPYPDTFMCSGAPGCGFAPPNDFSKSAMTTIRVPLNAFTGADLTDVRSVYLHFDLAEHPQGAITLDSLEFVQ